MAGPLRSSCVSGMLTWALCTVCYRMYRTTCRPNPPQILSEHTMEATAGRVLLQSSVPARVEYRLPVKQGGMVSWNGTTAASTCSVCSTPWSSTRTGVNADHMPALPQRTALYLHPCTCLSFGT